MYRECTGSRLLNAAGTVHETDYEGITVGADLNKGTIEISGAKNANGKFDFTKTL